MLLIFDGNPSISPGLAVQNYQKETTNIVMKNWALPRSKGMTCAESMGFAFPMSSKSKQIYTYMCTHRWWQNALAPRLSLVTNYLKLINWKAFKTQTFCCLLVSSPSGWVRAAQHWHPMAGPNNPKLFLLPIVAVTCSSTITKQHTDKNRNDRRLFSVWITMG